MISSLIDCWESFSLRLSSLLSQRQLRWVHSAWTTSPPYVMSLKTLLKDCQLILAYKFILFSKAWMLSVPYLNHFLARGQSRQEDHGSHMADVRSLIKYLGNTICWGGHRAKNTMVSKSRRIMNPKLGGEYKSQKPEKVRVRKTAQNSKSIWGINGIGRDLWGDCQKQTWRMAAGFVLKRTKDQMRSNEHRISFLLCNVVRCALQKWHSWGHFKVIN